MAMSFRMGLKAVVIRSTNIGISTDARKVVR